MQLLSPPLFALVAAMSLPLSQTARAGVIDEYQCSRFLSDTAQSTGSAGLLMTIAWAAGYAAAHQKKILRVDDEALKLIGNAIANECRATPDRKVLQVAIAAIDRFIADARPSDQLTPAPDIDRAAKHTGSFRIVDNYDLPKNDLKHLRNVEQDVCAASCQEEMHCKAYSYDKWNRWCWLKSAAAPLVLDPSSQVGIRESDAGQPTISDHPVRFEKRTGKRLLGNPYRTNARPSADECTSQCMHDDACLGATFIAESGTCRLFKEIENVERDTRAISTVKTQTPQ